MTDTPPAEEDDRVIRPFADFLVELRHGAVHGELSAALHDLIASVQATGKAGTLALTLKIGMHKGTRMLCIADSVSAKTPVLERDTSLYFIDGDGNASRDDPRQLAFEGIHIVNPTNMKRA
ncbi:hypothetical protein [Nocardia sp. NPDC057030]|uniref:hypothetical protein n=1 Tax=unclassified Nocardia TaxID=2637762 RepID=UPI00363860EC